jgi:hypothetical protein
MKYKSILWIFVLMTLLWAERLLAADEFSSANTNDTNSESGEIGNQYVAGAIGGQGKGAASGLVKYRVFLLRYISVKDGMKLLADANITNVNQLNDANMLLVCANAETLVKAAGIMDLADSKEKYAVKFLIPVEEAGWVPRPGAIAAQITGSGKPISIGTFLNMPGGRGYKAIIDVHEGNLIAVAPVSVMDDIVRIVERSRLQTGETAATA